MGVWGFGTAGSWMSGGTRRGAVCFGGLGRTGSHLYVAHAVLFGMCGSRVTVPAMNASTFGQLDARPRRCLPRPHGSHCCACVRGSTSEQNLDIRPLSSSEGQLTRRTAPLLRGILVINKKGALARLFVDNASPTPHPSFCPFSSPSIIQRSEVICSQRRRQRTLSPTQT